MHAGAVDQQAQRRLSAAARMDRAQECILNPHQGRAMLLGDFLAAMGGGAVAPDADQIALLGQADGCHTRPDRGYGARGLGQKAAVIQNNRERWLPVLSRLIRQRPLHHLRQLPPNRVSTLAAVDRDWSEATAFWSTGHGVLRSHDGVTVGSRSPGDEQTVGWGGSARRSCAVRRPDRPGPAPD